MTFNCAILSAKAEDRGRHGAANAKAWWVVLWVAVAAFGVIAVIVAIVAIVKVMQATQPVKNDRGLSHRGNSEAARAGSTAVVCRDTLVPPKVEGKSTAEAAAHLRKPLLVVEDPDPDYGVARSSQPAGTESCSGSGIDANTTPDNSGGRADCKVCFEGAGSVVVLIPCGHTMCENCVDMWFIKKKESTCPMCRRTVSNHTQKVFV